MSSNEKSLGLSSRPAAEAYVSKVCFKLGPPALVGAELEWLTALDDGTRPTLSALADALGIHSPRSIDRSSPSTVKDTMPLLRSPRSRTVTPGTFRSPERR